MRNLQRADNCKRPVSPQSGQEAPNDHSYTLWDRTEPIAGKSGKFSLPLSKNGIPLSQACLLFFTHLLTLFFTYSDYAMSVLEHRIAEWTPFHV